MNRDRTDEDCGTDQGHVPVMWLMQTYLGISAIHVHRDFFEAFGDQPPLGRRPGACTGAGATSLGDSGPTFVHSHGDRVWFGTQFDEFKVDVRHDRSEAEQVDDLSKSTIVTSSTATTACGLPTLRWLTGRSGSVPT
jgi:hypothetical protein